MNTNHIIAIAKKDLLEVRQNRAAWLPMMIVPIIFVILIPLAIILIPQHTTLPMEDFVNDPDLQTFLAKMPESMAAVLKGKDELQGTLILLLGYMFAPMFLIFPMMFSTIVASESFAGERERKTLEALLYTPASDRELFLGKVLAAFIPAVGISWFSFMVYSLVLNIAGAPIFQRIWFPLPTWWALIFWISPAIALLGICSTVLISARVKTFMGAYQTSSSLVIIVLGFMFGQISGVLYLTVVVGLLVGLVFWIVSIAMYSLAVRSFKRDKLLVDAD